MALTRATKTLTPSLTEIEYPESDGKPLGETGVHVRVTTLDLLDVIVRFYDENPNVAAHSNMFVYYVEGDLKRNVCPDLFVALKVPTNKDRRTYKVWEEGKGPDLVIEVTSKKTRREDTGRKFELYRDVLKVREYFLFDPFEEYLKPSLQGYRLVRGRYKPIAVVEDRLPSEVLRLHLERDGNDLRLYNPRTGVWEPTSEEVTAALGTSEAKRREAEAKSREAEAKSREDEMARREAEAKSREDERARREAEAKSREDEKARREAEAARREAEAKSREDEKARREAEAEILRLLRELDSSRKKRPE
ncbi:MAG TPA: Uma2 family endonuclease [Isosphaeraceae bacterium]|nr:Uma2 family endonuclease [Isosphaeraceae bacterium]